VKKTAVVPVLLAGAALLLSACGAAPDATSDGSDGNTTDTAGGDFLACMISDAGGFNDKSFNQSGYEGLQRAGSELGVKTSQAESKDASDFGPNLEAMQAQNCSLTITVGYILAEDTKAAAEANPQSHYAIIDDDSINADNVKPLVFKTSDASYLAGYLAAGYTKSGIVATYGGLQLPAVTIFMDGFADGVAAYNKDNNTTVKVLGWDKAAQNGSFAGGFDDQSVGKNTTQNFIDQGADVIMPVAGPVGLGTLAAVKDAGGDAVVIWVDADGYVTNPQYSDIILTSVMKGIGEAVFDTIKEASQGSFSSDLYIGTLANEGVGLAPYHDFDSKIPAELKAKIEQLKSDIIDGTLKVESPSDPKQS
jgi:basic membrane protein A